MVGYYGLYKLEKIMDVIFFINLQNELNDQIN